MNKSKLRIFFCEWKSYNFYNYKPEYSSCVRYYFEIIQFKITLRFMGRQIFYYE